MYIMNNKSIYPFKDNQSNSQIFILHSERAKNIYEPYKNIDIFSFDRLFLFLLYYLIFLPVTLLLFTLLLHFLRRYGLITRGTAEELLLQCHAVLRGVNATVSATSSINNGSDNGLSRKSISFNGNEQIDVLNKETTNPMNV